MSFSEIWDWLLGIDGMAADGARRQIEYTAGWTSYSWLVFLVFAALLAWVIIFYSKENPEAGKGYKIFLAILRFAILGIIIFMLMQPQWVVDQRTQKDSHIILLLDASNSMKKQDRYVLEEELNQVAIAIGKREPDEKKKLSQQDIEEINKKNLSRFDIVKEALQQDFFKSPAKNDETCDFFQYVRDSKFKLTVLSMARQIHTLPIQKKETEEGQEAKDKPKEEEKDKKEKKDEDMTPEERQEANDKAIIATYAPIPGENETSIGTAMNNALAALKGQYVAGLVLVTDGLNNTGEDPSDAISRILKSNPQLNIYVVGVGSKQPSINISVENMAHRPEVMKNDELEVDVMINSHPSLKDKIVLMELEYGTEKNRKVETKEITLLGTMQRERIKIKIEDGGDDEPLTVRIKPLKEETDITDNIQNSTVSVLSKKIKILVIENYPRWEWRYLKNYWIRDTEYLETCFVLFSADEKFAYTMVKENDKDKSSNFLQEFLKDFPDNKSFPQKKDDLKKFLQFDVIVIGDVDPLQLTTVSTVTPDKELPGGMKLIEEAVNQGRGIVFIAGGAFDPIKYIGTPFEKLLPVIPNEEPSFKSEFREESYALKWTTEGKENPIIDIRPEAEAGGKNETDPVQVWKELAEFYWWAEVKGIKAGAEVLAEHPTEELPDKTRKVPIIVTQRYGAGRVLYMGTDETWRLRYLKGDKYFGKFWQGVARFLAQRIRGKRVKINTDKKRYEIGEIVRLEMKYLDENYKPMENKKSLEIDLIGPDGRTTPILMKQKNVDENDKTIGPGDKERILSTYLGDIQKTLMPGKYYLKAKYSTADGKEETETKVFEVVDPLFEEKDGSMTEMREAAMQNWGSKSKGYYSIGELNKLLLTGVQPNTKMERSTRDLWDIPLILVLFTLLICVEWIVRKLRRLM